MARLPGYLACDSLRYFTREIAQSREPVWYRLWFAELHAFCVRVGLTPDYSGSDGRRLCRMRYLFAILFALTVAACGHDDKLCPGYSVNGNCGKVPFAASLGPSALP